MICSVADIDLDDPLAAVRAEEFILPNGVVDYYSLLGIDDRADPTVIKAAYRALAKVCHPDFAGEAGHNV